MKIIENKGFLTTPNAVGRSVPVKTPATFQIANEINGFVHVSDGTALKTKLSIPLPFIPLPSGCPKWMDTKRS